MPRGLRGTERHRDQTLDQARDHETNGPVYLARELLVAVAEGEARSLDLARDLAGAVLGDPRVRQALALEELLRGGSPFALVRAVELAEELLTTSVPARADHETASGGGQ